MNCSLDVSLNKIDEHGINETSQIVLYLLSICIFTKLFKVHVCKLCNYPVAIMISKFMNKFYQIILHLLPCPQNGLYMAS